MRALFLLLPVVVIWACQSSNTSSIKNIDTLSTIVGNDQDSLGCMTSAGFVWSRTKKTCVQPWEHGVKLLNVNSSASYQKVAYILIDSLGKQVEIFMAENTLILPQTAPYMYSDGPFNLARENHCWTISFNDKQLYQESAM